MRAAARPLAAVQSRPAGSEPHLQHVCQQRKVGAAELGELEQLRGQQRHNDVQAGKDDLRMRQVALVAMDV